MIAEKSWKAKLGKAALALALGAVGGLAAAAVTLPLPWMLGPMIVCTLGALVKAPIEGPMKIRPLMITVLGVMLGSGFSPGMADRMGEWAMSLSLLFLYTAVVGALAYPYFRRVGKYDPVTAYFAGMPGGLTEMMLVGHANGGDDRRIVLTHASRILLAVLIIPIAFRVFLDVDMSDRSRFGVALGDVALRDYAILAACALVGWQVATRLKIPAAMLVGPMMASAAIHLSGITAAQPPTVIVNLAQLVVGTAIGCRFVGVHRTEILRVIRISIGSTAMMLAVTALFAVALSATAGIDPAAVVLAFAPGGLAEMSLVALALGADVAFVATHHIVRIVIVVIAAPAVFRLLRAKGKVPAPERETAGD